MLKLNNRLNSVADFVTGTGIAVDIGTDHAYLPAFLIKSGKCKRVIACDVNEKPLSFAAKTINSHGLSDKVQLLQSNGLKNIPKENVSDVIIAGMGGELISQIISDADWLKKGTNLVLQPMTKAEVLRKWLYKNGFEIIREQAATDDGFTYAIIQSVYLGDNITIDNYFSYCGKIDSKDIEGRKYLELQLIRLEKIANGMKSSVDQKKDAREYFEIIEKIKSEVEI